MHNEVPPPTPQAAGPLRRLYIFLGIVGLPWSLPAVSIALAAIAASIQLWSSALDPASLQIHREKRDRIVAFDQISERLMMTLVGLATDRPAGGFADARDGWKAFTQSLDGLCPELDPVAAELARLRALCRPEDPLRVRLAAAFDAVGGQAPAPIDLQEVIAARAEIMDLRNRTLERSFAVEQEMARQYASAHLALDVSAAGFGVTALLLLGLSARAALRHRDAADRAHATQQLLQETIESIPAGVVLYDREERLLIYNALAAAVNPILARPESLGRTYEQLLQDMLRLNTTGGKLKEADIPRWLRTFHDQRPVLHQLADGRWFELRSVTTPTGNHVRVRVDVSSLKRQQVELEAERARYRMLVESLGDTVFALDRDGAYLYASPPVLGLLGVPAEQILGRNHYDFIDPVDLELARGDAQALFRFRSEEVHQRLLRMRTTDGEVRHVEVRYRRPLQPHTDLRAVVVGVMRDVTTTVRMTQRLAQERERLSSIVESSGAVLLLTDADLNIIVANREFWRLSRRAASGPVTRLVNSGLNPLTLDRWRAGPLDPESLSPARFTRDHIGLDGRIRTFSVTATPIAGVDGRLSQIAVLAVDDTERQAAEQALSAAQRMAILGEMAATVAHDIRQPLQVMILACETAEEEIDDRALVLRKLTQMRRQIERANTIVEELRLFARGSASDGPVPFDADATVQAAIDFTGSAQRDGTLRIEHHVEAGLPQLHGHSAKLEQVLVNLLGNARDAGATAVDISVATAHINGRELVRLVVADNGPGIPPHVLARLFTSFVTTKPAGQGTGLGLRICHRLVEEMGGRLVAANRPEGGAEFSILLPPAPTPA